MKLIDADAFAERLERIAENYCKCHDGRQNADECYLFADGLEYAVDLLRGTETAARPRGKWVLGKGGAMYFCRDCEYFAFPREDYK